MLPGLIVETRRPPGSSRGGSRGVYKTAIPSHQIPITLRLLHLHPLSRTWVAGFGGAKASGTRCRSWQKRLCTVHPVPPLDLSRCRAIVLERCTVLWSRGVGKSVPVRTFMSSPSRLRPRRLTPGGTALRCTPCLLASVQFHLEGITMSRGVGKISK
jgi:hypothetical protein